MSERIKGEVGRNSWRLTLDFADPESGRKVLKGVEHPFHNVV